MKPGDVAAARENLAEILSAIHARYITARAREEAYIRGALGALELVSIDQWKHDDHLVYDLRMVRATPGRRDRPLAIGYARVSTASQAEHGVPSRRNRRRWKMRPPAAAGT